MAQGFTKPSILNTVPVTATTVQVNLGNSALSGNFQITGLTGLTTGKPVVIQQAVGPYTGKGDGTIANSGDEAEMDQVSVTAVVLNSSTIQCYWVSRTFVAGYFAFNYYISA